MSNSPPTLDLVLRQRASQDPDAPMLCDYRADASGTNATWFSAADIDLLARRIGRRLLALGARGDRVLLCVPPGHSFTAAFFGCLYTGRVAVPAPIPGRFSHERRRLAAIARNAGASAVLTGSRFISDLVEWRTEHGLPLPVLNVEPLEHPRLRDDELADNQADDLALLQYTSGSTGEPKGVMLTHGNVLANADAIGRALGVGAGARSGGWLPNYHDMGLIGQLLTPIVLGGTSVSMDPMTFLRRPHLWLRMIDEMSIDVSPAPNFAYGLCTRRVTDEQVSGLDLSRWTVALNGSEPVSPSIMDAFSTKFAAAGFRPEAFAPAYGLAESTLLVSCSVRRRPKTREFSDQTAPTPGSRRLAMSCGRPTDADVRIVDPASRTALAEGQVGEIWISSGSVARGYWNAAEATEAVFGGITSSDERTFLRTGDLGFLQDGELHIAGRIKEVIVVRGRKLHPHDLEEEARLRRYELRSGAGAAFSVAHPAGGELLVLVHEIAAGTPEETFTELGSAVRHRMSKEFGVELDGLVLVRPGHVQRTTSGKIARTEMRRRFLADELKPLYVYLTPHLSRIRGIRPVSETVHG
ncbi:fatty acyl-AMP ligase [Streptomyces sp. NPDC019531]|uniref:fatty acyl-AMP ligase n=1 Tax=Streptomyces sp. NPDC019531 TaxID=3365062 RepID=UPI00384D1040